MTSEDHSPPPLSLRPFPVPGKEPRSLADFIARVNAQPGGFRAVTEAKLRDEAQDEPQDVDMADASPDAGDDDDQDDTADDALAARHEMMKHIDVAANTAMLTLDSLSLLLSKQNPTTASLSLSQQLRELVGIGTLGADKLDEPNVSEAKTQANEQVAISWTLLEIDKTRAAAQKASSLLQREVGVESRYWEDVMAVKKAGWAVCRVPNERHTLGVRFGFSESAPEFKHNGLAPMRRSDDGSVELDVGRLGGISEGIVVTYQRHGQTVGRCVPCRRSATDSSLEARVLEARNTIFAQELWHELTREAHTLAAYDVRLHDARLTCPVDDVSSLILELLPLADCPPPDDALAENGTAEAVSGSLHLLLSHAHRNNELARTRPMPPHVPRSRGQQQTCPLLRPIIARMLSRRSVSACARLVGGLVGALRSAGFKSSSFTLRTPRLLSASAHTAHQPPPPPAQALIHNMLQPLDFAIDLDLLPGTSLVLHGRTILFPVTTTFYHVTLAPPPPLGPLGPLGAAPCPDGYPNLAALADFLDVIVARALVRHLVSDAAPPAPPGGVRWTMSAVGTSARDDDHPVAPGVQFSVRRNEKCTLIELSGSATTAVGTSCRAWHWTSPAVKSEGDDDDDAVPVSEQRSLVDVVRIFVDEVV